MFEGVRRGRQFREYVYGSFSGRGGKKGEDPGIRQGPWDRRKKQKKEKKQTNASLLVKSELFSEI